MERELWAGIPMPLDGERLVLYPGYPKAAELMAMGGATSEEKEKTTDDVKVINKWWSSRRRGEVYLWNDAGKIEWGIAHEANHIGMDLHTLGCSDAWGIEQEHNAIQLLGTLVRHRQMKQYLLTGMFMETSERSGLTYIFRRLKPTVVIDARTGDKARRRYRIGATESAPAADDARILACLCCHPIGYYARTWAGSMCPTDDVVAHLVMMRGDEHLYWKQSTQHEPWRPEAGL